MNRQQPLTSYPWPPEWRWQASPGQIQQFAALYNTLLRVNQTLNLTRITAPEDFWEKHLWDSLAGIFSHPQLPSLFQARVIDVGTGAGFPAFPLAITWPQWQVTALDSTRKKIQFVQNCALELGLENVVPWVGRAETMAQEQKHRQSYDLAVIRAVAESRVCAEYILPLLKLDGWGVLYRGQPGNEDLNTLERVVNQLGGEITEIVTRQTPLSQGDRHFIYLRKIAPTAPLYPRAIGIPRQNPLTGHQ